MNVVASGPHFNGGHKEAGNKKFRNGEDRIS